MFFRLLQLPIVLGSIWDTLEWGPPLALDSDAVPMIVCDAGSTGSRIFGFYILDGHVHVERMGRTSHGIASFAYPGGGREATETLLPGINRGLERMGRQTTIHILATGGVRQLPTDERSDLLKGISGILNDTLNGKFQGPLHVRAVDGMQEALSGLIAANFIVHGLGLKDFANPLTEPLGVLDLGGSSLEISLPGPDAAVGSHDDILISFPDLGTNKLKHRLARESDLTVCDFGVVRLTHVCSLNPCRGVATHVGRPSGN
jgi:hypothetical protein